MWVFKQGNGRSYEIGWEDAKGIWHLDSIRNLKDQAAERVNFLNGGTGAPPTIKQVEVSTGHLIVHGNEWPVRDNKAPTYSDMGYRQSVPWRKKAVTEAVFAATSGDLGGGRPPKLLITPSSGQWSHPMLIHMFTARLEKAAPTGKDRSYRMLVELLDGDHMHEILGINTQIAAIRDASQGGRLREGSMFRVARVEHEVVIDHIENV